MLFPVSKIYKNYNFNITGASYAGNPRDNTIMYITSKVEYLVHNLKGHNNCLCFVDSSIKVPDEVITNNAIIFSRNPSYEYAKFATEIIKEVRKIEIENGYTLDKKGFYYGSDVRIGKNAYIEPGVVIGHGVRIGENAVIMAGTVIKHAIIGDNFLCNENAVIGNFSFTMAEDENGNRFRIPALGRVIIGNNVEVGACNDVAIGACGDTMLDDYVKLNSLVHVGHDAHLHKNTEVAAGAIIAGFVDMDEHSFLGINSSIKNRINLGENCIVGMGANVTKSVNSNTTVVGNPAKPFMKGI